MDTLHQIFVKVAEGVNWPLVFYILFGLFALGVLVRWVKLSPVHIAIEILKEIIGVLQLQGLTRTTIDGVITVALIVFTAVVLLFLQMRELPEFLSIFQKGVEGEGQSILLFVFMTFLTAVTTILSLVVTRR
jgi:hypothetical protein